MGINHIPSNTWDTIKTYCIYGKQMEGCGCDACPIYQNSESDTEYFIFIFFKDLIWTCTLKKGSSDCKDYEDNYKDCAVVCDPPYVFRGQGGIHEVCRTGHSNRNETEQR